MRANINKLYSASAKTGLILLLASLTGCGGDCTILENLVGDPGCRRLALVGNRTFVGTLAACAGTASSRKLSVNCPPSAGTQSHCDSSLNGFPVFSLLVLNNSNGSFKDSNGSVYNDCQSLISAFDNGSLQNVTGFFDSAPSVSGDNLSCTDAGGCTMTSQECYAGWDSVNSVQSGTASIPLGTKVLACTYIDTSSLGGPPPIAVGAWSASPSQFTVSGGLSFTSGWVDAN